MITRLYTKDRGFKRVYDLTNWVLDSVVSFIYRSHDINIIDLIHSGVLFSPYGHTASQAHLQNTFNIVKYERYGGETYQWYDFYGEELDL